MSRNGTGVPDRTGELLTLMVATPSLAAFSSPRGGVPSPTVRPRRGRSVAAVTKKDIVRTIAEQLDLPQLRTRELVQLTFDALIEALVRERRVELRNFGVFQIKKREARMARNPRTGERVPVRAKNVVTFKPGKEMEARVRQILWDDASAVTDDLPDPPASDAGHEAT
jgi:DNA-binding protein HU-beta/integration host factor subunit beta